jgi:hypothetical protein
MPLLNTSIPNLAQGVSQQPDNLRYPGQCDEQINAWSTVVEGLVKRPNSRFLYDTGLAPNVNSNLFSHFVDRDEQNKYVISYDSVNGLKARDLTADNNSDGELTITVEDAAANTYLTCSDPNKELRALTIADSTFIVNTTKTVATQTLPIEPLEKEALIFVKLGDYEKGYSIYIDGALVPLASSLIASGSHDHHNYANTSHNLGVPPATYISGPADIEPEGAHADTEFIAKDLFSCLESRFPSGGVNVVTAVAVVNGGSGFTQPVDPNISDYKVEVIIKQSSGLGGNPAEVAKGEATISSGVITAVSLSHGGSNFASAGSSFQFEFKELIKYHSLPQYWFDIANTSAYTSTAVLPTTSTWNLTVAASNAYSFERQGSVIKVKNNNNKDFRIRVSDGLADQGLGAIYKEVDSITDLPKSCFNGFRVKVIGDAELEQDDYYVRFKTKDGEDFGEGSWIEAAGWLQDGSSTGSISHVAFALDPDTMPVRLVPTPSTGKITGFTLKTVEWTARTAGDDDSNPLPSFTNNKINDIFFFKNRLGVLTDDAVVFSEADEYFNFFRTTTQSLLDSAPIDVGVSHTKISLLKFAQAFQQKLMLFSAKTQFVLRGGDLLTPKTVTISPVTEYDVSESIRPLALSSNIYFNFKRNNFEGLLEYTVDNNTETYGANEITEQVNKYIPANIIRMAGSAAENMIVVQSTTDYKKLYVYKYFWQGKEKIQSAWMTFTFAKEVRAFHFIQSDLYVITTDSYGTQLEKIPMENGLAETNRDYAILLDSRIQTLGSSPGILSAYVHTIAYTKLGSSSPRDFNGTKHTDVTYMRFQNNFYFKDGMAIYSKNGNKKSVTKRTSPSANDYEILIEGRLASYVNYSSHVTNNGDTYRCIQGHTSDANKEPGVGVDWESYWEKIETTIIADAWALGVAYKFEELYKCKLGHTSSVSILPTDTNYWQTTTEVAIAPVWSADGFEYLSEGDYFVGYEYDMLYRFSKQNLKQPTERGGRSASDYTYQTIRNGSIEHSDSGHFDVEVTPKFRDTYKYTYNPTKLASVSTLNKFTPETGFFKFAVQAQPNDATIEIKSSSALPVKLLSAEFESTIISRSKRYGG